MTLADPIPELLVVRVSYQQGTIVHVFRTGEACEVKFNNLLRVEWVTS